VIVEAPYWKLKDRHICQLHFEATSSTPSGKLIPGAVPTLFLGTVISDDILRTWEDRVRRNDELPFPAVNRLQSQQQDVEVPCPIGDDIDIEGMFLKISINSL
jgi:hypothetical protein